MSVADELDLRDENCGLLALADQRWGLWATAYPALAHGCGVGEMRSWLPGASQDVADEALHALATLAAVDGGDDVAAAAAFAWALMPGACTLANRLRTLTWNIDALVAAQLWVEVRTFPWQRMRKVAANVLMNTRTGVLRDCDVKSQLARTDPTWSRTTSVGDRVRLWSSDASSRRQNPADELRKLLKWGCANKVITDDDRALLLCVVEAADRVALRRDRGRGGLLADVVAEAVARQRGIAASTVRRRAGQSLDALASACAETGGRVPAQAPGRWAVSSRDADS